MNNTESAIQQQLKFDYSLLPEKDRFAVQQHTHDIKQRMRRAAQDIIKIGESLTKVKDKLAHGDFSSWLRLEFEWTDRTARHFMRVAEIFKTENFSDLNFAPSALYLLAAPSTKDETRKKALGLASTGEEITYAKAKKMVNSAVAKAHPRKNASTEYYAPSVIIDAAEDCFGEIELDPCSNDRSGFNVPARRHFSKEIDGLSQTWTANTIFLYPPHDRSTQAWVNKLVSAYESGSVGEAIILVPAYTNTEWFQELRDYPVCFVIGSLNFEGSKKAAPCAIFYLGKNPERFYYAFNPIGDIWKRVEAEDLMK